MLDELGQYDEAMTWLLAAKAALRTLADTAALERGYDEGERRRVELLAAITPQTLRRWLRRAWSIPQQLATSVRDRRRQQLRDDLESERLDRIREPWKYRGK